MPGAECPVSGGETIGILPGADAKLMGIPAFRILSGEDEVSCVISPGRPISEGAVRPAGFTGRRADGRDPDLDLENLPCLSAAGM